MSPTKKMSPPEAAPWHPLYTPHEVNLLVKRASPEARLPTRQHSTDIGWDLYACVSKPRIIGVGMVREIETFISIAPPPGFAVFVCSRSGLAGRGVFVANAPGIIDPGYRGSVDVLLFNSGPAVHYVHHHDRIAQIILLPIYDFSLTEVDELPEGERGEAGFGSTGR